LKKTFFPIYIFTMRKRRLWCELFVLILAGMQIIQIFSYFSGLLFFSNVDPIPTHRPLPIFSRSEIRHFHTPINDETAEWILKRAKSRHTEHNRDRDHRNKERREKRINSNKLRETKPREAKQKEDPFANFGEQGDSVEIMELYKSSTYYLLGAEGLPTRRPLDPTVVPPPKLRHPETSDFDVDLVVRPRDALTYKDPWGKYKRLGRKRYHWNDPVEFKKGKKWIEAAIYRVHPDRIKLAFVNESELIDYIYFKPGSQKFRRRPEPGHNPVKIPFVDCDGMSLVDKKRSRLSEVKEFLITSGASHFKKAFFWTGLLDDEYEFFAYNYSVNKWGKEWEEIDYRYKTMVALYNSGLFDQPRMSKIWGLCKKRYMFVMEWFPLGNMDRYIKLARFDDTTMKRYMPVFLLELIQSIIDLNNAKIVMCDWKMDQWMVYDVRGRLKLNDVDNCFNAYEIAVGKLAHCNCPFEFKPYRLASRPEKPPEKWTNRTWGATHWFKDEPFRYYERVERGKPPEYEFTCESYNDFLWDYGYNIHEYWFQTARLTEMTHHLMVKPKDVLLETTEQKFRMLVNRAIDVWNPMKVADYKTEVLKILADATEFDKEIRDYILRENKTWTKTYLSQK